MEEQVDREEDTLILMAAPVRQAGRVGIDLVVVEPEPPLFFTAFPAAYNSLTFHGGGGIGMCGGWPAGRLPRKWPITCAHPPPLRCCRPGSPHPLPDESEKDSHVDPARSEAHCHRCARRARGCFLLL